MAFAFGHPTFALVWFERSRFRLGYQHFTIFPNHRKSQFLGILPSGSPLQRNLFTKSIYLLVAHQIRIGRCSSNPILLKSGRIIPHQLVFIGNRTHVQYRNMLARIAIRLPVAHVAGICRQLVHARMHGLRQTDACPSGTIGQGYLGLRTDLGRIANFHIGHPTQSIAREGLIVHTDLYPKFFTSQVTFLIGIHPHQLYRLCHTCQPAKAEQA